MSKPKILITNDDGISAPGLRYLIEVMKELGDLVIIAPDKPQSGMAHAVTIQTPLRIHEIVNTPGYQEYSCSGTPVDCVKLGQKVIMKCNPDLIVSGINHGSNSSINVLYSGTMAAVIEGAMEDIPAIGFSLNDYAYHADFSHCAPYILTISKQVLGNGLPDGVCLNVNFPEKNSSPIKGIKVVRQAKAFWDESFDERKDPHRRSYFWLQGEFVCKDTADDTDQWALKNNYVSLVPVSIDLTAHHAMKEIKKWDFPANTSNQ
ncbi:MAG: 5'/3'-nucleotidase SurE [Bacteroidetes bacterium]|nr:5'/3'-nucleotidase SurE [Bacteroidota bacterium]